MEDVSGKLLILPNYFPAQILVSETFSPYLPAILNYTNKLNGLYHCYSKPSQKIYTFITFQAFISGIGIFKINIFDP